MHNVIRLIGDSHQNDIQYLSLIKEVEYSIQLGDHGFTYDHLQNIDSTRHRVLLGNHDNYDIAHKCPNMLGNYGVLTLGGQRFFFIRGGLSIDKAWRIPHVSWWPQEQFTLNEEKECFEAYCAEKPDFVLSHDCPFCCYKEVLTNSAKFYGSTTATFLERCFNYYQPKRWVHAHFHITKRYYIGKTQFDCLDELDFIDLPIKGEKNEE